MRHSRVSKANIAAQFASGLNCSQCVLAPWADELGYDTEELHRIAAAFGGGMFNGDTCGAVTGALIALGMVFGGSGDERSNALIHEKTAQFRSRFTQRCGTCMCRQLLGYDLSDPIQKQEAFTSGKMMELCPELVLAALDILDELISDTELP